MNYLRGALSAASQYYKDINPSTLTGAIDVIVIERVNDDGSTELACSPFHVRFGKWQVLRPSEKKVNVLVNGAPIPYDMKIGEAGEAFFVFETDDDVPPELITSPIIMPTPDAAVEPPSDRFGAPAEGSDGEAQPKRPQEPEFLDLDAPERPQAVPPPRPASNLSATKPLSDYPSLTGSSKPVRPTTLLDRAHAIGAVVRETVKEDAHQAADAARAAHEVAKNAVMQKPSAGGKTDGKQGIQDNQGDEALPRLKSNEGLPPDVVYGHGMVFDMAGYHSRDPSAQTIVADDKLRSQPAVPKLTRDSPVSDADSDEATEPPPSTRDGTPSPTSSESSRPLPKAKPIRAVSEPPDLVPSPSPSPPPQYSWDWGAFPTRSPVRTTFLEADSKDGKTFRPSSVPPPGQDKLQVPNAVQPPHEKKPMPFGYGGRLSKDADDDGRFWLTIEGKRLPFELSLCGTLQGLEEFEDAQVFQSKRVSYDDFINDPSIVHHDNLVMWWNDRYISRKDKSPLLPALVMWRNSALGVPPTSDEEPLSSSDELSPTKTGAPSKESASTPNRNVSGSSWSRWWRRSRSDRPPNSSTSPPQEGEKKEGPEPTRPALQASASAPKEIQERPSSDPEAMPSAPLVSPTGPRRTYAKTLRLTSDQLKALNLKSGPNTITFSLTATGTVACTARIFKWDSRDHIVISDIDGTITKSDAWGHVYTMIGRDWTHSGVAKLYTDICRNGYKIMYLTSRAIGQADSTRDYLRGINQNNYQLPEGPVVMSPDRLIASLHREVVLRKPEVFKMACLRDIQRLFGSMPGTPFYAGFGNRITDALSYRSVNVPSSRIFTIDSSGEVKMELLELAGYKSSYIHMTDLVDQMFPPIHRKWAAEYTDFNYWRAPMGEFELPDLAPPSPALSATSGDSNFSSLSRLRNFSLRRQSSRQVVSEPGSTGTSPPDHSTMGHLRQSSMSSIRAIGDRRALSDDEDERRARHRMSTGSMPGSLDTHWALDESAEEDHDDEHREEGDEEGEEGDEEEDEEDEGVAPEDDAFFDQLLTTGEMEEIPY